LANTAASRWTRALNTRNPATRDDVCNFARGEEIRLSASGGRGQGKTGNQLGRDSGTFFSVIMQERFASASEPTTEIADAIRSCKGFVLSDGVHDQAAGLSEVLPHLFARAHAGHAPEGPGEMRGIGITQLAGDVGDRYFRVLHEINLRFMTHFGK
jgi:hypothetical protein